MNKHIAIIFGVCAVTVTAGVGLSFAHSQLSSDRMHPVALGATLQGSALTAPAETQILRRTTMPALAAAPITATAPEAPLVHLASVERTTLPTVLPSFETPATPQLARVGETDLAPVQAAPREQTAQISVLRPKSRPTVQATAAVPARITVLTASVQDTPELSPTVTRDLPPTVTTNRVARTATSSKTADKLTSSRKLRTRNLIGVYR